MSSMHHNASISYHLAVSGADALGTRESPTNYIVDMDNFLENDCLEDKVDSFLSRDDAEGSRDPRSHCMASTKGFVFREISSVRASANKFASFYFSSDGKLLATGGHAKKQGYSICTITRHSAYVMSLDFYAIKVDVMCSCDGYSEIIFWSINNGGIVQNFKGGSRHLRFQPRPGGHLAAASENDVKPQACVRRFEGHTKGSLCWDSSGNVLYLPLRRMQ